MSLLLIWQKSASGPPTLALTITGGGSATVTQTTARSYALSVTGGGSTVPASTTNRNLAHQVTGGGSATIAATKAAFLALIATGGGSFTLTEETVYPRYLALTITGGGGMSEFTGLRNAYVYIVRSVHGTTDYEGIFHDTPRKSYRARP